MEVDIIGYQHLGIMKGLVSSALPLERLGDMAYRLEMGDDGGGGAIALLDVLGEVKAVSGGGDREGVGCGMEIDLA